LFTGIIECIGEVEAVTKEKSNIHYKIKSAIANELKIDQSVAHNGVCLTVVDCDATSHTVTAISETLKRSNLTSLKVGDFVNLERCLKIDSRLDGHFVQGHVDTTATCIKIFQEGGSWEFYFKIDEASSEILINKGSITINGVSLTLVNDDLKNFSVAIIPYTFKNTVFKFLKENDSVNIEFDIIGKYISKLFYSTQNNSNS